MTVPTRRDVLRTAAEAAAFGLCCMPMLRTPAMAVDARTAGYFNYQIGDILCTALYDGIWQKEHDEGFIENASVDDTKKALAQGGLPAGHVTIEFTQTLLETGGKIVLIDPGTGGQWVPTAGTMMENLVAAGLFPSDVDTILISHFHPDHIYGLMDKDTDAQEFPNAEIIVPAAEYDFWTDAQVFTKLPKAWHPLAARIQKTFPNWPNVRRVEHDVEVAPGIRSLSAPGHTLGHTAYHVSSGDAELIVAGDVAITPALFVANPGWRITYDADPELAEQTRRRLFDRVAADDAVIAGYHFGFPNAGKIHVDGQGYAFEAFSA